jgi:predicted RNase H-like nuclease
MYIGVDGCRGGWVVAVVDAPGAETRFALVESLDDVLHVARIGRATIVIDVPIGLPDAGPRLCDVEARSLIGRPLASSVFPAPCRVALRGRHDYDRASRLNERASGRRLSKQSFNLLSRIAHVDGMLAPALQRHVREGHPEVIFRLLAGRALAHGKKTPEGQRERLALLQAAGLRLDPHAARHRLGPSQAGFDDILDAAACACAAWRVAEGRALALPTSARQRDRRGLRMEIVA